MFSSLFTLFILLSGALTNYKISLNVVQVLHRTLWRLKEHRDLLSGSCFSSLFHLLQVINGYFHEVFAKPFYSGAQLIWDRALGLPLERPKSVTMEWLENHCKKAV